MTLASMERLAVSLAACLQAGDMVTLRGEVGAGKTTFARALVQSLMHEAMEVTSPTFNLMQSYEVQLANGAPDVLWHLDLYRLEEASEAEMLGLRELEAQVMLIEWPEIIEHSLPRTRLDITFIFGRDIESRHISFYGNDDWAQRIAAIGE